MHKLNFLSSIDSSEHIAFPRLQKRLLQCEQESKDTFDLFPHNEIDDIIYRAKAEAVAKACMCGILLPSYDDACILQDVVQVMETAVANDGEDEEYNEDTNGNETREEIPIVIQEDLVNIRLSKEKGGG